MLRSLCSPTKRCLPTVLRSTNLPTRVASPGRTGPSEPRPFPASSGRFVAPLFAGWLLVATVTAAPAADGPQVYATPGEAKANPDFAVQGEYEANQRGLQVIALGEGLFEVVLYEGGLPGAGWNRVPPRRFDADADTIADLIDSMEAEPVKRKSPTRGAKAPAGAVVLFDGTRESLDANWQAGARITEDGLLCEGATSKPAFQDYTLHLEFRTPFMPKARGQARGNSGVYHQGRFETQVLDSFGLQGKNNECGGIYTVRDPDLNMCLPPLAWQTYDVDFTAARYDDQGKKIADARMTVRLNGVVVQPDVVVANPTTAAPRKAGPEAGPIFLQNHGNPVRYRNIWVLPRDAVAEARRPRVPAFERFFAAGTGDPVAAGRQLITSLSCTACHAGQTDLPAKQGPNLADVGRRVRADHLVAMIADPHGTKPGTTMPDVWGKADAAERQQAALAIANYLIGDARPTDLPGDSQSAQRGAQLYRTIGCTACHDQRQADAPEVPTSVPLGDLAAKYTLTSLTAFLENPHAVRRGARMPKLVSDASEARDIACFLLGDVVLVPAGEPFRYRLYRGDWQKMPNFDERTPIAEGRTAKLNVAQFEPKNQFGVVFETYLPVAEEQAGKYSFTVGSDDGSRVIVNGKRVVDNDGIHPHQKRTGEIELPAGVHSLRVEYFENSGEESLELQIDGPDRRGAALTTMVSGTDQPLESLTLVESNFVPDASLRAAGRQQFQTRGCANCHEGGPDLQNAEPAMAKPLAELAGLGDQGCLASEPQLGAAPEFALTSMQRQTIRRALEDGLPQLAPAAHVTATLMTMNCTACHRRDQLGGPESIRDPWFETTTPEMGNEGRVPPMLTGVGDKLKDAYVADILQNGANERPYMKTRMPAFHYEPLRKLHQNLNEIDRRDEVEPVAPDTSHALTVSAGRRLIGAQGLSCIKCHTYDGVGVEGIRAIDAKRMPERLREDWFHRYLMDPQAYRPGTRMPASFVDGKSAITDLFDGDPHRQTDAMWKYLSAADAKPPQGLVEGAIVLMPSDRPVIYRNFLTDLSPRGIAVGYPEQIHLAWDAETFGLAKIWQNEFMDAKRHWTGRGQGAQGPLGDAALRVENWTPLAVLDDPHAPWPQATARQRGDQFLGYRLNRAGQPIFRYRAADSEVEDFCKPVGGGVADRRFVRTWTLTSDQPTAGRVLRLAVGRVRQTADRTFRVDDGPQIEVNGGQVKLIGSGDQTEVRVIVPADPQVVITETLSW